MNVFTQAQEVEAETIALRRALHTIPEVGMDLPRTAELVKAQLKKLNIDFEEIFPHCIKARVGKGPRKILLRADMDALPIAEKTGLAFAATNGNMHACGHDTHTAMLLGAAIILKGMEDKLGGEVIFAFQPGEEGYAGAKVMIDHGLLSDNPDSAVAIHIAAFEEYPSGVIVVPLGITHGSSDRFEVRVTGQSAHGSEPHKGKNPIIVACKISEAFTDLTRYEVDPQSPVVLTICQIHAGVADNIIPEECVLSGSLRTLHTDIRSRVRERMVVMANSIAEAYGVRAEVNFGVGYPVQKNNDAFATMLHSSFQTSLPEVLLAPLAIYTSLGSEDFAFISERVPSCYMILISQSPEGRHYPEHNPRVEFDDSALVCGVAAYVQSAISYFKE